mmetsp:Transcript_78427/g.208250  ORF Transcript_78427/g.208250 Transcript_78427/m.208250 type:complete len:607 (-) Transcript_78427:73-1893(-)
MQGVRGRVLHLVHDVGKAVHVGVEVYACGLRAPRHCQQAIQRLRRHVVYPHCVVLMPARVLTNKELVVAHHEGDVVRVGDGVDVAAVGVASGALAAGVEGPVVAADKGPDVAVEVVSAQMHAVDAPARVVPGADVVKAANVKPRIAAALVHAVLHGCIHRGHGHVELVALGVERDALHLRPLGRCAQHGSVAPRLQAAREDGVAHELQALGAAASVDGREALGAELLLGCGRHVQLGHLEEVCELSPRIDGPLDLGIRGVPEVEPLHSVLTSSAQAALRVWLHSHPQLGAVEPARREVVRHVGLVGARDAVALVVGDVADLRRCVQTVGELHGIAAHAVVLHRGDHWTASLGVVDADLIWIAIHKWMEDGLQACDGKVLRIQAVVAEGQPLRVLDRTSSGCPSMSLVERMPALEGPGIGKAPLLATEMSVPRRHAPSASADDATMGREVDVVQVDNVQHAILSLTHLHGLHDRGHVLEMDHRPEPLLIRPTTPKQAGKVRHVREVVRDARMCAAATAAALDEVAVLVNGCPGNDSSRPICVPCPHELAVLQWLPVALVHDPWGRDHRTLLCLGHRELAVVELCVLRDRFRARRCGCANPHGQQGSR